MNIFKKIRAWLRLYEAIRQADAAHEKTGERYYVMPTSGTSGQLVIMDREAFRKMKQKHFINRNAYIKDLENKCFYCTTYRNGTGKLTDLDIEVKRHMYYQWLESLKDKKNGKIRKH